MQYYKLNLDINCREANGVKNIDYVLKMYLGNLPRYRIMMKFDVYLVTLILKFGLIYTGFNILGVILIESVMVQLSVIPSE